MEILHKAWQGAKSVLEGAGSAALGFVTWWDAVPAEKVKDFAPFGIILVGFIGAVIAYRTMIVNRAIARKRAAIDVFIKTEMDQAMITAYSDFRTARGELTKAPDIDAFAQTTHYGAMRAYLNIHELIADRYWADVLTTGCHDARRVIDHAKTQPYGRYTYKDLGRLNRNWSAPVWIRWMRFGH